jgi:hypothetical protein
VPFNSHFHCPTKQAIPLRYAFKLIRKVLDLT